MLQLRPVRMEEKALLWNIHQKYLYEMTLYYPDVMDENGNYHYGYFDLYFTQPERTAYFLLNDDTIVGFAMLNPYSYIQHHPDTVLAEFTIFPTYRKRGFALDAARRILASHPGKWEIKFNEKNIAAKALWEKVAQPYRPKAYRISDMETVLEFATFTNSEIDS